MQNIEYWKYEPIGRFTLKVNNYVVSCLVDIIPENWDRRHEVRFHEDIMHSAQSYLRREIESKKRKLI